MTIKLQSDREIMKDNLIVGGLYSCFGFLGLFLVYAIEYFMSKPSPFGVTSRDPLVTGMEGLVIAVSIFMFWFSTRVYKNGVKHDKEMRRLFTDMERT